MRHKKFKAGLVYAACMLALAANAVQADEVDGLDMTITVIEDLVPVPAEIINEIEIPETIREEVDHAGARQQDKDDGRDDAKDELADEKEAHSDDKDDGTSSGS